MELWYSTAPEGAIWWPDKEEFMEVNEIQEGQLYYVKAYGLVTAQKREIEKYLVDYRDGNTVTLEFEEAASITLTKEDLVNLLKGMGEQ